MYRPPPHPMDEDERLAALRKYRILDTDPEPQFDRVAEMAKRQFDAPIGLVAFMDSDRNFLKARGDLPTSESPRDISFCGHTILTDDVLVVEDTRNDPRFAQNPLVEAEPKLRFYAGAPLVTPSGHRIGTVCVFDVKPRHDFGEAEKTRLKDLAAIVTDHLEMRLIVGNVHDEIETRRSAEAKALELAYVDTLTGLANRASLLKVLAEGPPFPIRGVLGVLHADVDLFKIVNDTLGHKVGDELLKRLGETIVRIVGDAFVARSSGDEFVILLDGESREQVMQMALELVEATKEPLVFHGHRVASGISIGVAFGEGPSPSVEATLFDAEIALEEAKRAGRRRAVAFSAEMASAAKRRRRLERDLPGALKSRQITVHYQPIHRCPDNVMIGAEALARWSHPELGWVSPVEFIAIAEKTGLILELGETILRTALHDAGGWGDVYVSVNLSPVQFRLTDLACQIEAILAEADFPAGRLQLEITESVLLDDMEAARRQIDALHALGIRFTLDDFGTGYSSLRYLRQLPFDKVKIDRSFVQGIDVDATSYTIVQLIVSLARSLGMRTTAEGVETETEAELLRTTGCNSLQGYLFGKPMPAAELEARLFPPRRAALG